MLYVVGQVFSKAEHICDLHWTDEAELITNKSNFFVSGLSVIKANFFVSCAHHCIQQSVQFILFNSSLLVIIPSCHSVDKLPAMADHDMHSQYTI